MSTTTVGDLLARAHHLSADLSSSGQASTNQQWRPFDLATYPASWEFSALPRIVPPVAGSHVDAETRDWAVMAPSTSNTMARATDSAYDVAEAKHLAEYVGDLLTSAEVAQIIRVPHATLRYWRHIGVGPKSFKMGPRRVLYREDDVLAWVAAQYAAQA